jgi:hypothetical protein
MVIVANLDDLFRYSMPRKLLSKEEYDKHISALSITASRVDYVTGKLPKSVPNYLADNLFLHVPKHYGIKNFGSEYKDIQRNGLDSDRMDYNSKFPLDEENRKQQSAFEAVYNSLTQEHGGALLALPPGDGKTTVACYTMSRIKKVR